MPQIVINVTDDQAVAIDFQNNRTYPSREGFLLAILVPIMDVWSGLLEEDTKTRQIEAFVAAPETATKREILDSIEGRR